MWLTRLIDPAKASIHLRIALLIGLFAVAPFWAERGVGMCLFERVTGLEDPLCGMTRAFQAISHGQFARAIHFNALSIALYFSLVVLLLRDSLQVLFGIRIPIPALLGRQELFVYVVLTLLVLLAYAIARNASSLP